MPVVDLAADSMQELISQATAARRGAAATALWYRGQACSEQPLLPSLMRGAPSVDAVFDRERRLITRFRQRSLPYWQAGYPQTDWEHMFAMQHHGLPTRLLDWTENLFVGIYFALFGKHRRLEDHPDCQPVVWMLNPIEWNRAAPQLKDFGPDTGVLTTADDALAPYRPQTDQERFRPRYRTPLAMYGTHNSARIVAQRGTFTIAGMATEPMDSFAEDSNLWRVKIDGDLADWRYALDTLGFAESMIYPDLPGLARELSAMEAW